MTTQTLTSALNLKELNLEFSYVGFSPAKLELLVVENGV